MGFSPYVIVVFLQRIHVSICLCHCLTTNDEQDRDEEKMPAGPEMRIMVTNV